MFYRKPFILLSIGGYVLLNVIFLVNSYWFYELKVQLLYPGQIRRQSIVQAEFLLFECLQDIYFIYIHHHIQWQRCSGRVPFIWVPPRHHRRRAAVCTGHAGGKDFRKRLIYFKIIQDNPGNHSKHDNYNGIYLNKSWCSLYKGVGSGHSGRRISNKTTFYLGRFQLHRLCGRLQVGRSHQTGFTIV